MTSTIFHKTVHITHIVKNFAIAHKIISVILAVVLVWIGYWAITTIQNQNTPPQYVTALVEKGTLITTVTGSGQVSTLNQMDLKAKASGDVVYIGVINEQIVKSGTLIAQINTRDAQKAVRDAEANLESARLSLEKIKKPADILSVTQSENTLARANETKISSANELKQNYEDAINTVTNVFLTLPNIMSGLQNILYSTQAGLGGTGQQNIDYYTDTIRRYNTLADSLKIDVDSKYTVARASYDANLTRYKIVTRVSSEAEIEALLEETYQTTRNIAEAIKSANNLVSMYKDELVKRNLNVATLAETHLSSINTYTGNTNTYLINLLNIKDGIRSASDAKVNAERSIVENTQSLEKLKAGSDALDIRSQELAVIQRENALLDARDKFADYFIRAPFEGTVTKITLKKGESISSGSVIGSLITSQKIVSIPLNEVDVAKIEIGQKTTLIFDAIDGLEMTGRVTGIDAIGTVSQGVVTYSVQITLDTQDIRIKSGMSVTATIITDAKSDILIIPNSAVKSDAVSSYVEMFDTPLSVPQGSQNQGVGSSVAPKRQNIQTGLSNDTSVEIIS